MLIDELNSKMGVGLATRINLAKDPNSGSDGFQINLFTMGNEHAQRLSNVASFMGHDSQFIGFDSPGRESVAKATDAAKAAIEELNEEQKANTYMVLAIADGILYMARTTGTG